MTPTTKRILAILKAVATYYTLTRVQIGTLVEFAGKNSDRHLRKLLLRLLQAGLINKTNGEVVFTERNGAPAPVYYPSRKGLEYITAETSEESWLMRCCLTPNWQYLHHWTNVAQFHIVLDQAIALQRTVQLAGWIGEWQVANPKETDPAKRFTLFTEINKSPRLVANPDFAFLLSYEGYRKVYYGELSRGTSGIQQIASSKTPGFAGLAEQQIHRRHFPDTNLDEFSVLAIEPSIGRRDLLVKALATKKCGSLWKVAAWPEVTPQSLLSEPIWRTIEGEASPLIRRE